MFESLPRRWRALVLRAVPLAAVLAASAASSAFADDAAPGAVVARDEFSTTTSLSGGEFRTRTYSEPVNFQADDGSWDSIQRSLVADADGTAHPVAVDGDLTIPSTLARPVVLEHDGRSVSFKLLGAGGDRDVAGTEAAFDDAIPNADISYRTRGNGVKETIELANASARRVFTYDVSGDSDLVATIDGDGDLVLANGAGEEQFRVSAPLAWDSAADRDYSNALDLSVVQQSAGHWALTMRPDAAWLDDPARVYPVTLDPDYTWVGAAERFHGANQDCYLASSDFAGKSLCGDDILQVGHYNRDYKSMMRFDIQNVIPAYATATAARFLAFQPSSTPKGPFASRLRTITTDWNNTATWDVSKTGTRWATTGGGGDVSSAANLTGAPTTISESGHWAYWDAPLTAVNGWIKRTLPNYGFQLSADPGSPPTTAYGFVSTYGDQASWPALEVTWTPDTTPPSPITGLRVAAFSGSGTATIAWDTALDPPLSDGTPGSGIAAQNLAVSVNGVARPVISAPDGASEVTGLATGNALQATLTVADRAGNVRTASLSVSSLQPLLDDPAVDSAAADAYQSEFGGTRAQAEAWIAAQNKVATSNSGNVLDAVRTAATASGYGGAYYDNVARQFVARVTASANLPAVNNTLSALGVSYRTEQTTVTADHLHGVQSDLEDDLLDLLDAGKLRIAAFESTGKLEFTISDQATAAENTRIRSAAVGGIPAVYTVTAGLLGGDPSACDPLDCAGTSVPKNAVRGGVWIDLGVPNGARPSCTLGFVARRSNGQRVGVTAGHCAGGEPALGQSVNYGISERRAIGNVNTVTYSHLADYALIDLPSALDVKPWVIVTKSPQTAANVRYPIRGAAPNVEGHWTCFTGYKTFKTTCGRVVSRVGEVTYKTSGNVTVTGLAVSTACSDHGDSGGPVFKAGYAYGVVSGATRKSNDNSCVRGYYTGAKTIESLESLDGLTFAP